MDKHVSLDRPRLRPLEAFPVSIEGERFICLRDPQGVAEQPIFLRGPLTLLVSLMDGSRTLRDIQADFMRHMGETVASDDLEGLVRELDGYRFLDSPSFRSFQVELERVFRDAPSRPAAHAGTAYEAEADALRAQLASFFEHPDGPGVSTDLPPVPGMRGLIAPHIDFHRGGPAYARAYRALGATAGFDRYLVFGTCHAPMARRFALTEKGYDTPLGCAAADSEFVRRLAARLPEDFFLDEAAHRNEHSIEFQAVWLRYLFGEQLPFTIVPILVGSLHDLPGEWRSPADDPGIEAMVAAVRATIAEMPGRTCIVAAADLAHVGRRFGDPEGPTEASMRQVEVDDLAFLELAARGDADGLFRSIAADGDRRRICGYPPIYMTLRCLESPRGELLGYRQWTDLDAGAAVTYASVALF